MDPLIFYTDRVKSKPENCFSTAILDSIFLAMSKNMQMFIQILMFLKKLYIGSSTVVCINDKLFT